MADNTTYVRSEMLPEKAPPALNVGVLGWIRANLFPNIGSSILTVLALIAIYMLLAGILPWIFGGIWTGSSLNECREALHAIHGESVERACWAVVHERFWQLMYGFYPSHLYWRPNLALILLFAALAPILFDTLPRKMLVVSIATPFVAPWLLWGGTIWVPVVAALGFVVGYYVYRFASAAMSGLMGLILGPLAAIIWWLLLAGYVAGALAAIVPLALEPVASREFGGFMLAVTLGITGIAMSFPIGIVLALGRQSNLVIIKTLCVGFIEFIRGVPLITLLFVAQVMLAYFLPKETQFDIPVNKGGRQIPIIGDNIPVYHSPVGALIPCPVMMRKIRSQVYQCDKQDGQLREVPERKERDFVLFLHCEGNEM